VLYLALANAATTKRAQKSCDVAFAIYEFEDHVEFEPSGDSPTKHDHSLDESDANKRNSFLRDLLANDIARNLAPAVMVGSIRGDGQSDTRARLNSVGSRYLSRQDAINSGASWRLANPNALFVSYDTKDDILAYGKITTSVIVNLHALIGSLVVT